MADDNISERRRRKGLIARMSGAPRHVSIPVGVGLIVGGTILAPLPIFGVWMVPVGLAILAPHSPRARRLSRRIHRWSLKALRWSIRNGFVRVKTRTRAGDQADSPPSDDV
ncbi:MAG: PGPGW domain-containing protein [Methylocystis sp.]|uniref:PGPGW domain-containing protein n=1 Tax=Methylocystis sp. TaxID=1911079 RepID=UPI003D0D53C8